MALTAARTGSVRPLPSDEQRPEPKPVPARTEAAKPPAAAADPTANGSGSVAALPFLESPLARAPAFPSSASAGGDPSPLPFGGYGNAVPAPQAPTPRALRFAERARLEAAAGASDGRPRGRARAGWRGRHRRTNEKGRNLAAESQVAAFASNFTSIATATASAPPHLRRPADGRAMGRAAATHQLR